MNVRQWTRDLGMGTRFAFTGRGGWVRALLTAVGVGLGVALLLITTAIPNALDARDDRGSARSDSLYSPEKPARSDATALVADVSTYFRDEEVRGRALEPEGPRAPLPPGLSAFPGDGELVVSPALERLLNSDEGALLRERLPGRITGTVGRAGLIGPSELLFYRGADGLAERIATSENTVNRVERFGDPDPFPSEPLDPVLLLLVLVMLVALLMPVAVFIAAAVRFGGERRDRRLAALRLVGSDGAMTRRVAAGEALAGAALGVLFGAGFFLAGRQIVGSFEVFGVSVFPGDLDPSPALAALVALAVPAAAVLVTLFALRGVVIEPLGVVRTAKPARRRLWWRLLVPLAGLGMLVPMIGQGRDNGDFNQYLVIGGVMLLLVGITALLPWVVEAVVARMGAGSVSWQLAVRRLQLSGGTAARTVNGIAVAVAGAIALQMLFAGVESDYETPTGTDVARVQMQVDLPAGTEPDPAAERFRRTKGVRTVHSLSDGNVGDRAKDPEVTTALTVADCATLRQVAKLPSCREGDVFAVHGAEYDTETPKLARTGRELYIDPKTYDGGPPSRQVAWTLPKGMKRAEADKGLSGNEWGGFLATPSALPKAALPALVGRVYLGLDRSVPDAEELVRNTAAAVDPYSTAWTWQSVERSERFDSIRNGLFVGASCVLALIGASLLVSQLEQLRERRNLLSALVAFGTRRRTLGLSVLWQTALPIALGLALACAVGLALGAVLLRMTDTAVRVDWPSVLAMTGIGGAVVVAVTLLSLPPLVRLMRPEGLRTE
ncbi:ABC transporter permease [Streptomyces sp. NPDC093094]|uniref:ABC transporter permease n=1 Tax=Streptomyces sp. NPDC093094 TaxID=3366026 RepID=UPI003815E1D2